MHQKEHHCYQHILLVSSMTCGNGTSKYHKITRCIGTYHEGEHETTSITETTTTVANKQTDNGQTFIKYSS